MCWADKVNEREGPGRVLPVLKALVSHSLFNLGSLMKDFTPSKNSAAEIKPETGCGGACW